MPARAPLLAEHLEREVGIDPLQLARGAREAPAGVPGVRLLPVNVAVEERVPGAAPVLVFEALLGLTLGWIRRRSSTSVAILVHGLYDIAAVLTLHG